VSTIPTPFIGGSESPRKQSTEKQVLAPPFHPGETEAEEATTIEVMEVEPVGTEERTAADVEEIAAVPAESDIPDFLFGPDGAEPEDDEEVVADEEPKPLVSLEELAEQAQALQQGELGDRIRALVAELGSDAAEVAIARAFAAGYLAARDREEK
jgi:hypothetical protein